MKTSHQQEHFEQNNSFEEIGTVIDTNQSKSLFKQLSESFNNYIQHQIQMRELAKTKSQKSDKVANSYEMRIEKSDIPNIVSVEIHKILLGVNSQAMSQITQSAKNNILHFNVDGIKTSIEAVHENPLEKKYLIKVLKGEMESEYILEDETGLTKVEKEKTANNINLETEIKNNNLENYPLIANFLKSSKFTENRQIKALGINNLQFDTVYRLIDDNNQTKLIFRDGINNKLTMEFEVEIKNLITIKKINSAKVYVNDNVITIDKI